jgi:phosphoenolpyruvate carboxylase
MYITDEHCKFFADIQVELALSEAWIRRITGQQTILHEREVVRNLIRLRAPWIAILNAVQVILLRQGRVTPLTEAENEVMALAIVGIAAGRQNTG